MNFFLISIPLYKHLGLGILRLLISRFYCNRSDGRFQCAALAARRGHRTSQKIGIDGRFRRGQQLGVPALQYIFCADKKSCFRSMFLGFESKSAQQEISATTTLSTPFLSSRCKSCGTHDEPCHNGICSATDPTDPTAKNGTVAGQKIITHHTQFNCSILNDIQVV